jgi:hypothetical protein
MTPAGDYHTNRLATAQGKYQENMDIFNPRRKLKASRTRHHGVSESDRRLVVGNQHLLD